MISPYKMVSMRDTVYQPGATDLTGILNQAS
jgi:hypothetical protein